MPSNKYPQIYYDKLLNSSLLQDTLNFDNVPLDFILLLRLFPLVIPTFRIE